MEYFKCNEDEFSHELAGTADVQMAAYGAGVMLRIMTFRETGVGAVMHNHIHEQISYVERGKIQVVTKDGPGEILCAGDSVYFAPYDFHEVLILEKDTKVADVFTPIRVDHLRNHLKQLEDRK